MKKALGYCAGVSAYGHQQGKTQSCAESRRIYSPPDEGWTEEDFRGDVSMLETVRAIEDPTGLQKER